jgi:activating signal cointegrator 1
VKVLTLTQPWASLVANGSKSIETRSWRTPYRGPLLIHAAKGFPKWAKQTCEEEDFRNALGGLLPNQLPVGCIICRVSLLACVKVTEVDKLRVVGLIPRAQEIIFGDYSEGRWAWGMKLEERFIEPIKIGGQLGLWEYEL